MPPRKNCRHAVSVVVVFSNRTHMLAQDKRSVHDQFVRKQENKNKRTGGSMLTRGIFRVGIPTPLSGGEITSVIKKTGGKAAVLERRLRYKRSAPLQTQCFQWLYDYGPVICVRYKRSCSRFGTPEAVLPFTASSLPDLKVRYKRSSTFNND